MKAEVASDSLGSPSLIARGLCGRKATFELELGRGVQSSGAV